MSRMIKALCIVAHEPDLDPRIGWMMHGAPKYVEMECVGFFDPRKPRNAVDRVFPNITIRRVPLLHQRRSRAILYLALLIIRVAPARGLYFVFSSVGLGFLFAIFYSLLLPARSACFRLTESLLNRNKTITAQKFAQRLRAIVRPIPARVFVSNRISAFKALLVHFSSLTRSLENAVHAKADIVHANDLDTLLAGVSIAKRYHATLVYDAHEYWPYSIAGFSKLEVYFWRGFERLLVRRVNTAVTVSTGLAKLMTEDYQKNFDVVPNASPRGPLTAEHGASLHNGIRFIFQGIFAPGRGLEELITGWSKISDQGAMLFLRGPDNEFKRAYIELAEKLGVWGKTVFFIPPVEERQLVPALYGFDVGIIPYLPLGPNNTHCCPNKLSQYMQAGVAVMSNRLEFVSNFLAENDVGCSYSSDDPNSVRTVAEFLRNNPDRVQQFKDNARRVASELFNWEAVSPPLYRPYEKVWRSNG